MFSAWPLNVRRWDIRPFWAGAARLGGQVLREGVIMRRVFLILFCSVRLLDCSAVAEFSQSQVKGVVIDFRVRPFFEYRFPSFARDDDQKICRYPCLFFVHPTL